MKVNKNTLVNCTLDESAPDASGAYQHYYQGGTPLRLEIAARILTAFTERHGSDASSLAYTSLRIADALIEAHNATCEEQTES
jgi:hypothetical protein